MKSFGRKPVIAVPYWPGSNGDHDAVSRIQDYGMQAEPLYFHFGNDERLAKNAARLLECDGAFVPGGFPYEDRLGFGRVPSRIKQFSQAMKTFADSGKPVIAICAGNQIAHAMELGIPSPYKVKMLPNICDDHGQIVYSGFLDGVFHTRLLSNPQRNAFTRNLKPGEVMPQVVDHGGGRFWADPETLAYLIENDLIVKQYCDDTGNVDDNFPTNPNGSMLNIESITNVRGNIKLGMCHDERKTNANANDRAGLSFTSMKEYIEDGYPDLSVHAVAGRIPIRLKDYSYLCPQMHPARTYDLYIKMLTDDNGCNTAELFLGDNIERRRLIKLELADGFTAEDAKRVVAELARMDILDGIMPKKDLPFIAEAEGRILSYEVVEITGGSVRREFIEKPCVAEGFPAKHEDVASPNPHAYELKRQIMRNGTLAGLVTNVQTGSVFFFKDEETKARALAELL